jgi:hypothetical protein
MSVNDTLKLSAALSLISKSSYFKENAKIAPTSLILISLSSERKCKVTSISDLGYKVKAYFPYTLHLYIIASPSSYIKTLPFSSFKLGRGSCAAPNNTASILY